MPLGVPTAGKQGGDCCFTLAFWRLSAFCVAQAPEILEDGTIRTLAITVSQWQCSL